MSTAPEATRQTPNPSSALLKQALIGGVGLGTAGEEPPAGYAAITLFLPAASLVGKAAREVQADLGLPWMFADESGHASPVFFDDL